MTLKPANDESDALADFHALYVAHASQIRKVLYRYAGSADIDDLVQDTFIKAWSSAKTFRGESQVATWLVRIAINVAKDHQRARRRKWWLAFFPEAGTEEPHPRTVDSEMKMANRSDVACAIDALSPKLRDVVVLYSLNELEVEEIGEILDLPIGTVKSRLHQARAKMREVLEEAKAKP